MDQSQVRWAFLKISLLILAVSTWISAGFVLATRPESPDTDPLMTLVRLPASLPAQLAPEVRPAEPIRMETVKLGCWDLAGGADVPVAARWVRLTGRPCQSGADAEVIRIHNESNGYQGTVFSTRSDQMTSDFIPLQEGVNTIRIRIAHADGLVLENDFTLVNGSGRN